MMGKSWGAFNSLQVAARRPPELKAIIAVMGTDDRFEEDVHYSGGCLLSDNLSWGAIMQVFNARPPDPEIVGPRWRDMWLQRLEAERFWPEIWLQHQKRDAYWKHGSVCTDYAAIACPVWVWGGWADGYRDSPFRLASQLQVPHKITMGPWAHLYPHQAVPGPAVGFLQEALRWWDQFLKLRDTGVLSEPPYRFYMVENARPDPRHADRRGRWVAERKWPSPNVRMQSLALNPDRLDLHATPERALSLASPQTTGLAAGEWSSFGIVGDLPGDQRLDSFGSLEFRSDPLPAPLEVVGNAEVILDLAADRPDAFVAVRLIDAAPDGSAALVARGFLNLRHRDSREDPTSLIPGERYQVRVRLNGMAYSFAQGNRLMLAISNAYWPLVWPSPEPVVLTVFSGASRLLLPVREPQPADAELAPLPEPIVPPPSSVTRLGNGRAERAVTIDQVSGSVSHRILIDGDVFGGYGRLRLDDIGLEMRHEYERTQTIGPDDSNSASYSMTQCYELRRGAWKITLRARTDMTSTARSFELSAWLEAHDGETLVRRKEWKASLPRETL
ncbi:MAG: Peptidase, partial [Rhodospirillales bacterium]|nr:Peptidase [Rhodospirillales bacterium]